MISTADEVFTEEASQPFNRFADAHQIRVALNTTFSKGVEKMCKQIGEILVQTKNALKDVKVEKVEETVDLLNRYVFNTPGARKKPQAPGISPKGPNLIVLLIFEQ